jgi:predicted enzyme related to lactoylglutathione lyase
MPSPVHGRFVWTELLAHDVTTPRDFYAAVCDWTPVELPMEPEPYPAFLAGEIPVAGMMRMRPDMAPDEAPHHWLGYVGVDSTDATYAEAMRRGAHSYREPMDIPGVGRFAVIGDPWGAVLAMLQPVTPDAPPFPAPVGHLAWADMGTDDLPGALEFYGALFGWTAGEHFDMGALGPYQIVQAHGLDVVGLYQRSAEMPPPAWIYYTRTAHLDDAVARCSVAGGSILMAPHEVPDGSRIAVCLDPVGAVFALVESAPHA